MSLKFSTAYRNMRMLGCSFKDMFEGGELVIYTGSGPSTADLKPNGTRLCTVTLSSGVRTAETYATALLAFSGGAVADTVDNITLESGTTDEILGAQVAWVTSDAVTADNVATQINKFTQRKAKVWAYSDGAGNVTVYMCPGHGDSCNTDAVAVTITQNGGALVCAINGASADQMGVGAGGSAAGVDSANGLTWGETAAGVIAKTGTWSGACDASGTAGYWRLVGGSNATDEDSGGTTDTAPFQFPRIQGTCGLAGADMNMDSLTFTSGNTYTIDTFQITEPDAE
jgi:hypothetical protein